MIKVYESSLDCGCPKDKTTIRISDVLAANEKLVIDKEDNPIDSTDQLSEEEDKK